MSGERYSNAAIMAGLSDVAGWLENEGGRDKHVRTIRTGIARLKELAEAAEAAEEAAYEELNAVGARVQQGWDADESVFDAARLCWLEAQARKSRTGISFDWVPPVEGERSGFRFMRRFFVTEQCDTLKAAIDRAMLEDPTHVTDRQVDPAAEIARLVAAVTGERSAPCDGSGAAGETEGLDTKCDSAVDVASSEVEAPIHTPTPQETARVEDDTLQVPRLCDVEALPAYYAALNSGARCEERTIGAINAYVAEAARLSALISQEAEHGR